MPEMGFQRLFITISRFAERGGVCFQYAFIFASFAAWSAAMQASMIS